jgi:formylglycine-generating enzyme required for sulfatase activity
MIGNVREWCRDRGAAGYDETRSVVTGERLYAGDGTKVARGGSFCSSPRRARSAARDVIGETRRENDLGIRASRDVDP